MSVPLVLLPGMNCSSALWAAVVDRSGVEVITPELDVPTIDEQVATLLARLPARFALAGLSLGGILAMALVRTAPHRVSRLALVSTNAAPPTPEQRTGWRDTIGRLAAGASARQVQADLLDVLFAARSPGLDEAALAMADDGEVRLRAQLECQLTRVDERPGLRAVTVPTLVLHGDADRLCPPERHQEIAALVPVARRVMLPGAGHLLPLERPIATADAMADWLGDA